MGSFWKTAGLRTVLMSAAACSATIAAPAALAQEQRTFEIPSQNTASALNEFSRQADVQILFPHDVARSTTSPALNGAYMRGEALNLLIRNTGLELASDDGRTIVLRATNPTQLGDAGDAAPSEEVLIITGTRIRGVADQFSPVTRISRDDMDLAGQATVADVFDTLPANFGGVVSPDTSAPGTGEGAGAAGVNLRGLGTEATLVLLNGRRLAPGGLTQSFVDISAISAAAIDRIEVLPDSASAIYGTDAVAGVVNIITRDDFNGAETRAGLHGGESGGESVVLGQTFGWSGDRAHGLVTYQYLEQKELNQNDRDFSRGRLPDPYWLLPSTESHSLLASGGVEMTPRARFDLDAFYNRRESDGSTSSTALGLARTSQSVEIEQYGVGGGLHVGLVGEWAGDVSLAYSRSSHFGLFAGSTAFSLIDRSDDADSELASIDVSVDGPLLHITDEPVELAFGAHARAESAEHVQTNRTTGAISSRADDSRSVASGYFELYAPLIGPGDGVLLAHRLAFTAAGRYDDYDDVGSTFNPRLGLSWSPVEGLNLRGGWGTAFRAPAVENTRNFYAATLAVYDDPVAPGGSTVLILNGRRTDLGPEEAETWTAGFDFEPLWLERFRLRATYFNVSYDDRLGIPSLVLTPAFHFANFTGTPIRDPNAAEVQALVDNVTAGFVNAADFLPIGPLSLADVTVILDARLQNLSRSEVEGVDVEVSYSAGDWSFFVKGTYLSEATQQVAPTAPMTDLLNTFANPIDVRLRGGASWSGEWVTAALFVNHVGGYTDDESTDPTFGVDSWTTFDASLRLDVGRLFGGEDRGTSLTFTLENLLDEEPPRIGPRAIPDIFYDAANADPSGRRIGVLLSTRW